MFKKKLKMVLILPITIMLVLGMSISLQSVLAQWVAPAAPPPGGNMPPPIWSESGDQSWYLLNKPTWVGENFTVSNWDNPGGEEPDFFVDTSDPNLPKVGIGTDVPQADLHIKGDGHMIIEDTSLLLEFIDESDDDFRFYGNNNDKLLLQADPGSTGAWSNDIIAFESDGDVGVGTNDPQTRLHVQSDEADWTALRLENEQSTNGVWELRSHQNDPPGVSTGAYNNAFSIWGGDAGSEDTRLMITSDGKVGIGSDDPQALLHIFSDNTPSTNLDEIVIEGTGLGAHGSVGAEFINQSDSSDYHFKAYSDGMHLVVDKNRTGNILSGISMNPDGKVGIGTSNPNPYAKLSIDNESYYVDWSSHNDLHNDLTVSNADAGITIISRNSSTGSSNLLLSEVEDNSSGDFEDSWAIWRTTKNSGSRFHIGYFDKSYSGYWGWGEYQAVTIGKNLNFGLHTGDYIPTKDLELWGQSNEPEFTLVRDDSSVYQDNVLGEIWFDSRDGTISTVDGSAGIKAIASESHSSWDKGAHLAFYTKPTNRNYNQSAYERMRIDEAGNVGIGDTTPDYKLDVEGSCGGWASCNEDVAEVFPKQSTETIEPGDVVVLDGGDAKNLHKSTKSYDTRVAGIYSTDPGLLIRGKEGVALSVDPQDLSEFSPTQMPLALAGRVPVNATNENGNIMKGDLLTSSSRPGRAMKCSIDTPEEKLQCMGAVLGKAMEDCDESECLILAIVTLQ